MEELITLCAICQQNPVPVQKQKRRLCEPCKVGNRRNARSHGFSRKAYKTPEYIVWLHIIARCENPNNPAWHNYGGRGISMYPPWRTSFPAFLAAVGNRPSPAHSIDRFPDNNGNYEPGNVRWATRKEQGNNRRGNRTITYQGETHTITEWAELKKTKAHILFRRYYANWSTERIFEEPIRGQR